MKHILGLVCVNSRLGNTEDWWALLRPVGEKSPMCKQIHGTAIAYNSESVDLGNFVEITVVGVEVTSERLESLSALNLHPWGSILLFDYRSEQGGETVPRDLGSNTEQNECNHP